MTKYNIIKVMMKLQVQHDYPGKSKKVRIVLVILSQQ